MTTRDDLLSYAKALASGDKALEKAYLAFTCQLLARALVKADLTHDCATLHA
jgi:hypothetical protein